MKNYIYQKFLLNCNYDEISLDSIPQYTGNLDYILEYVEPYCLLDVDNRIIRKLNVSFLDTIVDDESDWEDFLSQIEPIDELILYYDVTDIVNPIIYVYRDVTLKAYIYRILKSKVETEVLLMR